MPKKITSTTSAPGGWVALGLLVQDSPQSGYDLTSLVSRSIGHFWPLTKAQIYAELPKLEASGFVVGEAVTQENLPDKRLYRATREGKKAFQAWLRTVQLGEARLRHPLLLKIWFGTFLDPEHLAAEIEAARGLFEKRKEEFEKLHDRASRQESAQSRPDSALRMRKLAIRHAILRLEAEQRWLEEVAASFEIRRK
jgi:DNA-binding PadR family transcriptional regulator